MTRTIIRREQTGEALVPGDPASTTTPTASSTSPASRRRCRSTATRSTRTAWRRRRPPTAASSTPTTRSRAPGSASTRTARSRPTRPPTTASSCRASSTLELRLSDDGSGDALTVTQLAAPDRSSTIWARWRQRHDHDQRRRRARSTVAGGAGDDIVIVRGDVDGIDNDADGQVDEADELNVLDRLSGMLGRITVDGDEPARRAGRRRAGKRGRSSQPFLTTKLVVIPTGAELTASDGTKYYKALFVPILSAGDGAGGCRRPRPRAGSCRSARARSCSTAAARSSRSSSRRRASRESGIQKTRHRLDQLDPQRHAALLRQRGQRDRVLQRRVAQRRRRAVAASRLTGIPVIVTAAVGDPGPAAGLRRRGVQPGLRASYGSNVVDQRRVRRLRRVERHLGRLDEHQHRRQRRLALDRRQRVSSVGRTAGTRASSSTRTAPPEPIRRSQQLLTGLNVGVTLPDHGDYRLDGAFGTESGTSFAVLVDGAVCAGTPASRPGDSTGAQLQLHVHRDERLAHDRDRGRAQRQRHLVPRRQRQVAGDPAAELRDELRAPASTSGSTTPAAKTDDQPGHQSPGARPGQPDRAAAVRRASPTTSRPRPPATTCSTSSTRPIRATSRRRFDAYYVPVTQLSAACRCCTAVARGRDDYYVSPRPRPRIYFGGEPVIDPLTLRADAARGGRPGALALRRPDATASRAGHDAHGSVRRDARARRGRPDAAHPGRVRLSASAATCSATSAASRSTTSAATRSSPARRRSSTGPARPRSSDRHERVYDLVQADGSVVADRLRLGDDPLPAFAPPTFVLDGRPRRDTVLTLVPAVARARRDSGARDRDRHGLRRLADLQPRRADELTSSPAA